MTRELIADVSLIASDPDSYFSTSWGWPTRQSVYDETISKFMFGVHELHNRFESQNQIALALGLVKADLLKDFSYFMAAWIDVSSARQAGLKFRYAENQFIFRAVDENIYPDIPPSLVQRIGSSTGLKNWIRTKASYLNHKRKNSQAISSSANTVFTTSLNPLGEQIVPPGSAPLRLTTTDVVISRPKSGKPSNLITELSEQIEILATDALSRNGFDPSKELKTYFRRIGTQHLNYGVFDVQRKNFLTPKSKTATLLTGTGSGYSSRLLSLQFLRQGHDVVRTSHGGDAPLFKDVLRPTIEFPFCSTYVVNGPDSARLVDQSFNDNPEAKRPYFPGSVISAGSKLHQSIPRSHNKSSPRRVAVISASFNRMYRITPFQKVHDVVYFDWHRRLLKAITDMGYDTVAKRHPKGHIADVSIFQDVCSTELIRTPMVDVFESADAFVIDFPASAFMEAICTEKPVVLIDMGLRQMHSSVRSRISNSVAVINASFDEKNRVMADFEEIRQGLETPVDVEERSKLVQDFLTRSTTDTSSIFNTQSGND